MVWIILLIQIEIFLEKFEGGTIDIIPDGKKIEFSLHVPTETDIITIPCIEVIYSSEWNLNTVILGKVSTDNDSN